MMKNVTKKDFLDFLEEFHLKYSTEINKIDFSDPYRFDRDIEDQMIVKILLMAHDEYSTIEDMMVEYVNFIRSYGMHEGASNPYAG